MNHRVAPAAPAAQRTPRRRPLSLQAQVALVIATLSLIPNLVMMLTVVMPIREQLVEPETALLGPLVGWLLVVIALSAGIGYLLSRQLLAPLRRLSTQIHALGRNLDGPMRKRIPAESSEPPETLALKRSFNELLREVDAETAKRTAFMATLVHDLKTPLVANGHLLAVVRDTDTLSRAERIDVVAQILQENGRLLELVQKMVDAHKFERMDVHLNRQSHRVSDIARSVLERVRPLARERGVTLNLQGDATALVDEREFDRALYNLVSNAVRYARSKITLEVYPGVLRLSDDGPGLPEPLERLAQPFNAQPVDIAGQRYNAGTGGLGLFIARRVIEAHGGRLLTEITGPSGTVLLVYYPQVDEARSVVSPAVKRSDPRLVAAHD